MAHSHPHPPFRAEHTGSLVRPKELDDARSKFFSGDIGQEELEQVALVPVHNMVQLQQRLGFKALTDGEFRRYQFEFGFFDNLEGVTLVLKPAADLFTEYSQFRPYSPPTFICTGKIRRTKPCYVPWFVALAGEVAPEEVKNIKITIISPEWCHFIHGNNTYENGIYDNDEEYFADIAKAYREELDALHDAGCRNIQIDSALLSWFCSVKAREGLKAEGIDPDKLFAGYIALLNDCLSTRRPDMHIGVHICRGNVEGGIYFVEGGYDTISIQLFSQLTNVDTFFLEYDTPRAGNFEPLRHLPATKHVVLGLISTKVRALEDKHEIIARINEAAQILGDSGKDRICLSPQCGFRSWGYPGGISEEDMEKKLALVADVAREVWGTTT